MTTAKRRPRRFSELTQHGPGKRDPLEVGCWVVAEDPAGSHGLQLALVTAGPTFQHSDGVAIQALWDLHDGTRWPTCRLTRLDLADVLEGAIRTLNAIRRGCDPAAFDEVTLRTHRAACLARKAVATVPDPQRAVLRAVVDLDEAVAELEQAWREMVRVRLPNLAKCLWSVGMLEVARRSGWWEPGISTLPHPRSRDLAELIR